MVKTAQHVKKHWTSYSGWAGIAIVLAGAFWAWSAERATLKAEVSQNRETARRLAENFKAQMEVRTNFVDSGMENLDKRQRDHSRSLTRIETRQQQAERERKDMRETLRRIWGAVRNNRRQR